MQSDFVTNETKGLMIERSEMRFHPEQLSVLIREILVFCCPVVRPLSKMVDADKSPIEILKSKDIKKKIPWFLFHNAQCVTEARL